MEKKKRATLQRKMVTSVLSIAGIIVLLLSFFIKDKETQDILGVIGVVFLSQAIFTRLFKPTFGHKPTREEIEEKTFGKEE